MSNSLNQNREVLRYVIEIWHRYNSVKEKVTQFKPFVVGWLKFYDPQFDQFWFPELDCIVVCTPFKEWSESKLCQSLMKIKQD
jgi:hypothetical protein